MRLLTFTVPVCPLGTTMSAWALGKRRDLANAVASLALPSASSTSSSYSSTEGAQKRFLQRENKLTATVNAGDGDGSE